LITLVFLFTLKEDAFIFTQTDTMRGSSLIKYDSSFNYHSWNCWKQIRLKWNKDRRNNQKIELKYIIETGKMENRILPNLQMISPFTYHTTITHRLIPHHSDFPN
jgi:hypothetical protein